MKEESINRVLDIGIEMICLKGYHNLGLRELLETAKIPSGSFYYYFKSKEDFAYKAAAYYGDMVEHLFKEKLLNQNGAYLDRFSSIFKEETERLKATDYKVGCALGDLGTEVSSQMDDLRKIVEEKYASWQSVIQTYFRQGQELGTFKKDFDPEEMAIFFLSNRQGALTRVKSSKSIRPYEVFQKMMMTNLGA